MPKAWVGPPTTSSSTSVGRRRGALPTSSSPTSGSALDQALPHGVRDQTRIAERRLVHHQCAHRPHLLGRLQHPARRGGSPGPNGPDRRPMLRPWDRPVASSTTTASRRSWGRSSRCRPSWTWRPCSSGSSLRGVGSPGRGTARSVCWASTAACRSSCTRAWTPAWSRRSVPCPPGTACWATSSRARTRCGCTRSPRTRRRSGSPRTIPRCTRSSGSRSGRAARSSATCT